uniref:Ig-like domain-containing protein n=1 Tax=Denticeps clupeoides TaxID=299321 RepID=A0AAY4C868_9TELE
QLPFRVPVRLRRGQLCISGSREVALPLPPATWTLDLSHNRIAWLAAGSFHGLPRMEALRLSHNAIAQLGRRGLPQRQPPAPPGPLLQPAAVWWRGTTCRRLPALEELLLFNNRIAQSGRATRLIGLSRAEEGLPQPQPDHRLPLLLHLEAHAPRPLGAARLRRGELDFKEEYNALLRGEPRAAVHFLRRSRLFENCHAPKAVSLLSPRASVLVHEGELVRLDCATSQAEQNPSFSWTSPHQENITQLLHNGTLRLNPDGSLEIPSAQPEDSGTYRCAFFDSLLMLNETREINLTVVPPRPPDEPFNTGYTTLLGVRHHPGSDPRVPLHDPMPLQLLQASKVGPDHARHARKANADRRVVFLEPLCEEQNGHAQAEFSKENLVQFQPQNLAHVRIPDYEPGFCNAT